MVVNIVKQLITLGFSEYEARAYTALVKSSPATAYEIAKSSGLPTSKIYEVISRLAEKGLVLELVEKAKKRYIPQEPDEFVSTFRTRVDTALDKLKSDLNSISDETNVSYIWNVRDYEMFLVKAKAMIIKAQKSILLSVWPEEINQLKTELESKSGGIQIAVVHFGKPDFTAGRAYYHPIEDTIYSEKGGRGFALVVDSEECLCATVTQNRDRGLSVEGAFSKNPGFATLAEDYIKHDIYIMKIVNRFDPLLIERFGKNYKKLRDIFHDDEEKK